MACVAECCRPGQSRWRGRDKEARAWIKRSGDVAAQIRLASKRQTRDSTHPRETSSAVRWRGGEGLGERQQCADVRWCKQRKKPRRDETRKKEASNRQVKGSREK